MLFRLLVCGITIFCLSSVSLADVRTWSDASGTNKVEAEYVAAADGNVQLRRADGRVITVPIAKLSQADQDFIQQMAEADSEGASPAANNSGVRVELIGLEVGKPLPEPPEPSDDGFIPMMIGLEGTVLRLWLQDKQRPILGLDEQQSKLVSLQDDRGTDLLKSKAAPAGGLGQFGFGNMAMSQPAFRADVAPDKQSCTVDVMGDGWPAKGARQIRIEATLVLKVGDDLGNAEAPAVELTEGGKLVAGPLTFVVERTSPGGGFGDAEMIVTLKTNDSLEAIQNIEFLDATGNVIPHTEMGTMTGHFGGESESQIDYGLAQQVDRAGMRVSYYKSVNLVEVPVNLETGVGF